MSILANSEPPSRATSLGAPARSVASRRVFVSLGLQVTVLTVLLVAAVASGIYFGLVRQSRLNLLTSQEAAADLVVKLTTLSVAPAVVFDDDQEMQRALSNLARNPDVSDVELWGFGTALAEAAEAPLASFHRPGSKSLGRPGAAKSQRFRDAESLRLVEPVRDLGGKTVAALAVRFSSAREAAVMAQLSRQILLVAMACALGFALAILLAIHRIVVRPVERLEQAAVRLTRGERYQAERSRRRVEDEVVRLGDKFGAMAEAVRDRELRIGLRNAELKLILDSVDQGFLTVRMDGSLLPERSAIVGRWVGPLAAHATLWDLVARIEPDTAPLMNLAWQQLFEDVLPIEVAVDQLPKRLSRDGQHFSLAYHPGLVDGQLQQVVVVITDVTAELERQRAHAEQQEFAVLVDQFVRDRRGFHAFWDEASRLVLRLCTAVAEAPESLRRDLHTLKGNSRFFGLNRVSALCHELETSMAERGEYDLSPRERTELRELWDSLRERIEPLMQGASAFLEVSREQYERLLDATRRRSPSEELEQLVRGLRRESVYNRLERASAILEMTCARLEKSAPKVEIQTDLHVPPGPWAPFWSILSHVLTNAADHGLESDEERARLGKPVPGTVWLTTTVAERDVIIEVRDDGRGIDWSGIERLAADRGLPHSSRLELEQALFTDGLTLKQNATELSGRGVGLGAVRAVVTAMGGKIEVASTSGVGTTWRFRFPTRALMQLESDEQPRPTPSLPAPRPGKLAQVS
ncbi:MAG: ATP-binding protein [Polyangiaceae bacterium]